MVAGPWFTVRQEKGEWEDFGTVWFSDGGSHDGKATLQLRLNLEDAPHPLDDGREVVNAG